MMNEFSRRKIAIPLGIFILALAGCKPIAQLEFKEDPDQATTVHFSSQGSVDRDGSIVSYQWDFGDGQTSSEANPAHVYAASGDYVVKLVVVDDDGEAGETQQTVMLTRVAVSQAIGQEAVSVKLSGVIDLAVPAQAFSQAARMTVSQTAKAETQADFDETSAMLQAPKRSEKEVRVNVGKNAPLKTIPVKMKIPADLLEKMGPEDEVAVYVQIYQNNGQAILDSFEFVRSALVGEGDSVGFDLLPEYFTDTRTDDQSHEAVILIGSSKTKPVSLVLMRRNSGADEQSVFELIRPWPSEALPEGVIFDDPFVQASQAREASSGGECKGASLEPPLRDLTVTGPFNPPKHNGVDYRAANGTDVLSMADGTVAKVGFDERPLKRPDPRSGKMVKGWGNYVVIKHADGSSSLYAHLQTGDVKVKPGQQVSAGDVIALSDNSGGSQAPHLHVEYAPNGQIFDKAGKVDPDDCIDDDLSGSVTVSDNGNLADDAFTVSLNGLVVCKTTIGAANTCVLGALRPGSATLSVRADIAPDDVGTYQIQLSNGVTFSSGGTSVSGTIGQGASASFVINIPKPNQ